MLRFQNKDLRAQVIAPFVRDGGYRGCVCFSCGNASAALKRAGLYVLDVSPGGDLEARRWWRPEEVARCWPGLFDATSGHLPAHLMVRLALMFRQHLGPLPAAEYDVPTGSGETIICLRWAYPNVKFNAVQDGTPATEWHIAAPLLQVALFPRSHVLRGPIAELSALGTASEVSQR